MVGQRLDVIRLWFATALTGVDVNNVKADGIVLAESRFLNQRPWAEYDFYATRMMYTSRSHQARNGSARRNTQTRQSRFGSALLDFG